MSNIEFIVELREFPGYFISTFGRIFSKKLGDMKELKQIINTRGYFKVNLYKESKFYTKTIHKLVGDTFLKRKEGKNLIDHINQNKLDNRLENLRWADKRDNGINSKIRSDNKSGIKGVRFRPNRNCWVSRFQIKKNKTKSKHFKTKEEAIKWRNEMEEKYYQIL